MMCPHKVLIKIIVVSLLLLYYLLPASITLAQNPDYDRINEIAKQLNCPTCTGINLADCHTQTCEQWREQINDLLKQGYTDEEIINYFTARYGDYVLQEPPKSGWTLALWMVPLVIVLVGGGLLFYILSSWKRQKAMAVPVRLSPTTPEEAQPARGNYLRQVEHDLYYNNDD